MVEACFGSEKDVSSIEDEEEGYSMMIILLCKFRKMKKMKKDGGRRWGDEQRMDRSLSVPVVG
jgi:hypothetical protein